jgi:actin related protein 2/3 complex subunit 5
VQDQSAELVFSVISAVKDADIKSHIDSLSDDQLDLLMKYLYRAMANADNSAALLKWHAMIVEKAGLGCIVRAFAERKTVC